MGSISAMSSVDRVLEKHGDELQKEAEVVDVREVLMYLGAVLENDIYGIKVIHRFCLPVNTADGGPREEDVIKVPGETLSIDSLSERFPDCEVGY